MAAMAVDPATSTIFLGISGKDPIGQESHVAIDAVQSSQERRHETDISRTINANEKYHQTALLLPMGIQHQMMPS